MRKCEGESVKERVCLGGVEVVYVCVCMMSVSTKQMENNEQTIQMNQKVFRESDDK